MHSQYSTNEPETQTSSQMAEQIQNHLALFLAPFLVILNQHLDKRFVQTCAQLVEVIITFRDRCHALLLSELGAYLDSPAHAPAGTKRISNLLRSPKWDSSLLERFFWDRATLFVNQVKEKDEDVLGIWDESVLEKAESIALEGLCPVRSSKSRRLNRIKKGYYRPPSAPTFVPGMHWIAILLCGRQGPPLLAHMRWWTSRGKYASNARQEELWLLQRCMHLWGANVLHIFDRGYAGGLWVTECLELHLRFILRWTKDYQLFEHGHLKKKAWMIARGKKSWSQRHVWDARTNCWFQAGVVALPVQHPEAHHPLWLVVSRPGKGRPPWYLLTNEEITTEEDAWRVVFAYARRWQIEMAWRYNKSEFGFECPRLWSWENRVKLLLIATLAYAFLLTLLDDKYTCWREWLLTTWCHRTGKKCREATAPLYRLRTALSRLWLAFPPPLMGLLQTHLENSG
ncbi:transposase [Tengunoibacter tsumagoiensis]|uniref:Transposase IS4-like domain-containing protein n=1 Tax=Tengunoibacter tsumagoiensis TaxID=2014871 RepID=A0A401ZTM4_9CHLR|nr:transposase [Tengunoibacter tsumagoiensis]GCE10268.1 hypothetical protein KTT_01270 [Tengunoibacter tsumagoiensis]